MAVSEYGEVGRLVQLHPAGDMVVLWTVYEVKEIEGRLAYRTSRGWVRGNSEAYFPSRSRERSLKPCILRAIGYAKKSWPNLPTQTH